MDRSVLADVDRDRAPAPLQGEAQRLGGATATNSARLHDQAIAQIVARNLAVEAMTDPEPPSFGTLAGEAVNAGRRWVWTRTTARSPEARIQQIEIRVTAAEGGPGRATLIVFRRAAT
jgi:general secretion pathway protein I